MLSPASINWYPTFAVVPGTTRPITRQLPPGKLPSWPVMVIAAFGVALGIFALEQWDVRAGWLLAFLILMSLMIAYRNFGSQLQQLAGKSNVSTSTPGPITAPGNTSRITNPGLYGGIQGGNR